MTRNGDSTRTLYLPHTDGTISGSPVIVTGTTATIEPVRRQQLPAFPDLTQARTYLASYLAQHPAAAHLHPPGLPLAIHETDARATRHGRLLVPVAGDHILTDPHRQIVAVGPHWLPHPRALAVPYGIAWAKATSTLHAGDSRINRARTAVDIAWRHGYDLAHANTRRAVISSLTSAAHRNQLRPPPASTPEPPTDLYYAAARLAGSAQIVELVQRAWHLGISAGAQQGIRQAVSDLTAGQSRHPSAPPDALARLAAIGRAWSDPELPQLAGQLHHLAHHGPDQRIGVLSRLHAYLNRAGLTTPGARPIIRFTSPGPARAGPLRPPPAAAPAPARRLTR